MKKIKEENLSSMEDNFLSADVTTNSLKDDKIEVSDNQYTKEKTKLTAPILIVCILIWFGVIMGVSMLVFSSKYELTIIGKWYPTYLVLSIAITFIISIGLFRMKDWAAISYAGVVAINQIIAASLGIWNAVYLIPIALVIIVLSNLKKMD